MASQCDWVYGPHMSIHRPASRGSLRFHWWGICACLYMAMPMYELTMHGRNGTGGPNWCVNGLLMSKCKRHEGGCLLQQQ